jgi:Fur family transcriptional regulator, ferric uptake regulator
MKLSRNTVAKTAIENLMTASSTALSHAEIQHVTNDLCDRVTVYRVLDRLVAAGKIHKVIDIDGVVKYAGCHTCLEKHNHHHIHFSCQKCKMVTCLDDIKPSFKLPKNYKVSEMNFTLSGLCPQCV